MLLVSELGFFLSPKPQRNGFAWFSLPFKNQLGSRFFKKYHAYQSSLYEGHVILQSLNFRNKRKVHELAATILLLGRYGNEAHG